MSVKVENGGAEKGNAPGNTSEASHYVGYALGEFYRSRTYNFKKTFSVFQTACKPGMGSEAGANWPM